MQQNKTWPNGYQTQAVAVIRGEFRVASDDGVVLSTVLGSCVSVCLFDGAARIGGMNHYLLADASGEEAKSLKYGVNAMELLINSLLKRGASRPRLKAKVFGGSRMSGRFAEIGPRNAAFALHYLAEEDFEVVAQDLGGTAARRVNFHPVTGLARVIHTNAVPDGAIPAAAASLAPRDGKPAITLF